MIFNRLKTRTRIHAGFVSLIVLGLVVAAVGSWGISGLGRQSAQIIRLASNFRYVANATLNEELVARVLLRARDQPADSLKAAFEKAQAAVRRSLTDANSHTLSTVRRDIYQGVLDKLDPQARSAEKTFALGRTMVEGRTRLFSGGDELTDATTKLVEAARKTGSVEGARAAAVFERAALLVRVANWRFLATKDPKGPATFSKNNAMAVEALAAFEKLDVPGMAPFIAPVRAALTAYADAFSVTAPAMLALAAAYDSEQRPTVTGMQDELSKTDESLSQDAATAAAISADLQNFTTVAQMVVAALGLVVGILLAFIIGRGIVRPLTGMTDTMVTLAGGNHDVAIPATDRTDEIGDMARAVEIFKTNMIEAGRLAVEQEAARAARSRRQDAMDRHTQAFGTSVTGVMAALGNAAGNMRKAADVMTEAASAVHREASETAGGAGKSSADLTAVAAAVEQFTASVGEISRQVAVASEVATQAVQRAESSQNTIRGLADSTARIGDVVRLIDTIASQTNLLALNATIEAARAGDAGKGFAVVAGEVKALAAQTAKATAEIGAQIETVRSATDDTVNAMNEIGSIIGRMGEVSTAISAAVEEQSVTTREIASSIQGVAGSTAQAAHAMGHVVQVADRAGDASRDILSEASEIGAESEKLRREVEAFLHAVQTDSGERRRSERLTGNGVSATLTLPGAAPVKAMIQDLSRSGVALRHAGQIALAQDVEIDLPGAGGPLTGRVLRVSDGVVAIGFSETPSVLAKLDRALASLTAAREAA
jgi:methyl-accepting chemotaxis protein